MENNSISQRSYRISKKLVSTINSDRKVAMINEIDVSALKKYQNSVYLTTGTKPTYTTLMIKAISNALHLHPVANRIEVGLPFFKKAYQISEHDISVAVEQNEMGKEMIAFIATVYDVDTKTLASIQKELHQLSPDKIKSNNRWKKFHFILNNIPSSLATLLFSITGLSTKLWRKHRGGAILISSPCKYGVDTLVGHWPSPIGFSFGLVKERIIADKGKPVVRPTMKITMSFDRCLMAGAPAAKFFNTVTKTMETAFFDTNTDNEGLSIYPDYFVNNSRIITFT